MEMRKVASTNLGSVGYDSRNGILRIRFRSGSSYDYDHVPEYIYTGLMSASSHGRYHAAFIKNFFSYRRN